MRGKGGDRGAGKKTAVVGLLQRAGKVFTKPVDRCTKDEIMPILMAKLAKGIDVFTDGWNSYDALAVYGFNHKRVVHEENEFSDRDGNHINGIESFWSFYQKDPQFTVVHEWNKVIFEDAKVIITKAGEDKPAVLTSNIPADPDMER